jgi:hypothetical protein
MTAGHRTFFELSNSFAYSVGKITKTHRGFTTCRVLFGLSKALWAGAGLCRQDKVGCCWYTSRIQWEQPSIAFTGLFRDPAWGFG